MSPQLPPQPGGTVFDVVAFLLSSARLSLDEAPRYASIRLLMAVRRLLASDAAAALDDPVLDAWNRAIDENLLKSMDRYPEYAEWLGELARSVAEETVARNLA
jgi:Family of unknown function (DUF6092)